VADRLAQRKGGVATILPRRGGALDVSDKT
jgi:hypothetical protein